MAGAFSSAFSSALDVVESGAGGGSGWYAFLDIVSEAVEDRRAEEVQPPEACPHGGRPLLEHRGVWYCPDGDYEWPRDGRLI